MTRALTLALFILALVVVPTAQAARSPLDAARFDGLSAPEQAFVEAVVAGAPPRARRAIAQVAPQLTIRRGALEEAARGDLAETEIDGEGPRRYVVAYGPQTLMGDARGRHMVLHELAHAIDDALLDDAEREQFTAAFLAAPLWVACYPQPQGSSSRCVPWSEIFADQFAFYANGDRDVRSSYRVPPLLGGSTFGRMLERVTAGRATV